jgi:hypothetical protein
METPAGTGAPGADEGGFKGGVVGPLLGIVTVSGGLGVRWRSRLDAKGSAAVAGLESLFGRGLVNLCEGFCGWHR